MAALDQALRNDDSAYEKFTQFENVLSEQYGYDNSLTTARRQDELAARTRKKLTGLWAILGQSFGAIEKPLEIKFLIAPCYVSDSDVPILQMVPLRPSSALAVVVYQVKKYYSNRDGTDDLAGGSLNNVLEFPSFYAEVDIQRIKNGPVLPLTDENIQQYMKNMQCIYVFGNHRQGYCIDMGHGEYSFIMGVGQVDLEIGQGKAPGTQTARRVTVFKSRNNKLATHTHLQTIESSPPISIPQPKPGLPPPKLLTNEYIKTLKAREQVITYRKNPDKVRSSSRHKIPPRSGSDRYDTLEDHQRTMAPQSRLHPNPAVPELQPILHTDAPRPRATALDSVSSREVQSHHSPRESIPPTLNPTISERSRSDMNGQTKKRPTAEVSPKTSVAKKSTPPNHPHQAPNTISNQTTSLLPQAPTTEENNFPVHQTKFPLTSKRKGWFARAVDTVKSVVGIKSTE